MKKSHSVLVVACATLVCAASGLAQTTSPTPTNPTGPAQVTPGGSNPGTTNPAGIVPGTGRPTVTTTGPAVGTTGMGTMTPILATGVTGPDPSVKPGAGSNPGTANPAGIVPGTGRPTDSTTSPGGPGIGGPGTITPPGMTGGPGSPGMPGPGNANPHMPNENASDTAKAVMAVMQQFDAKRDQAVADRKTLIDQLGTAKTDADRQAIMTQLHTETQAEREQQSAMGKQIRDELKKLRDQRKSGGG